MNKLMARIFAVVMVVVMLGTVSFAATSDIDENGNLVSDGVAEGWADQAIVTVLAFATNDEDAVAPGANDKIIAIHQGASADATEISVDESLTENFSHVVVLFSGNAAEPVRDRAVIALPEDVALTVTPVFEWEYEGKTYTNVVFAKYVYEAEAETTISKYGFKFYSADSEGFEMVENANTTIEAGSTFEFSAVILAVPEEKQQTVIVEAIVE